MSTVATAPRIAQMGGKSFADTGARKYFEAAVKYQASDLLIRSGRAPRLRLKGVLKPLDAPPVKVEDFDRWVEQAITADQMATYKTRGSIDLGFDLHTKDMGSHRFRVNVFLTRGKTALAARRVDNKILSFDELKLPASMAEVCMRPAGIILFCGITGSGKSTSIASMLQHINQRKSVHIITIEDPIEFLFEDDKAVISQREVGIDVATFPDGLRAMVREDPDIVLIGEMRDRVTFESALQAAETGHLVFGTIHSSSAPQAFARIYDLFTPDERANIRSMLAYQFQAFIYQKLLPTLMPDVSRVPAVEILLQSPVTRKYILDQREHELNEVIKNARQMGMQSFTDALVDLVMKQWIHPRVAFESALNPEELKMRLKGIEH
jgi:twitching motility protein PilT